MSSTSVRTAAPAHGGRVARWRAALRRLTAFGIVGAIAFVVDAGLFNLLRATVLAEEVVIAKVLAATVSIAVAWIGHRTLVFRRRREQSLGRELGMFVLANLGGLLIAAGCLWVSHDLLGLRSVVADNVAGNLIGVALGTAFRFACYQLIVFRAPVSASDDSGDAAQPKSPAAKRSANPLAGVPSASATGAD
ncbi:GtrA family protein [Schumannella luteola]|uniref:Putative flippase GtrA n=1 Tax=Schumannella luteola TaxID=472059 RepID=A0A852YCP0_9MICO|nr:GtrA family protein [Schumannella luteola]NYG99090.1 putative flippase GtrA [Schumannella luteola]TPX06438.1 GtrA family protein [Schumannella luteola]